MDKADQRKITRNLTLIKERIESELDNVVDKCIEKDVFNIYTKEDIDSAQPPTPQKRAGVFVTTLLKSGPKAYKEFISVLSESGHHDLVDTLESTEMGESATPRTRGRTFVIPHTRATSGDEAAGDSADDSSGPGDKMTDHTEKTMKKMMVQFEEKVRNITDDLRDEFEQKRAEDKKEHAETMAVLKKDLDRLTTISEEYERLKEIQKKLRQQLNEQQEKMVKLNKENVRMKKETEQTEEIRLENKKLASENLKLAEEKTLLETEIKSLEKKLGDKEIEVSEFKAHIEEKCKHLKSDLHKQGEQWEDELNSAQKRMNQQNELLSKLAAAVEMITKSIETHQGQNVPPSNNNNTSRPSTHQQKGGRSGNVIPGTKTTTKTPYNKYTNSPRKKDK